MKGSGSTFLFLLIVGISTTVTAAPSKFRWQSLQPHLSNASVLSLQQALQQKQCKQAQTLYAQKKAILNKVSSRAIRLLLGRCWSQQGEWSKARQAMKPYTRRSYVLWDYVHVWIGDTYKGEKKFKQAVKSYLRVNSSSLLYREARLRSARMLLDAGQPAQALQSIQSMPTWARRPSHWWVAAQAGHALNTPQGRKKAAKWATIIWVKAPTSSEARQVRQWQRQKTIRLKLSSTKRIQRAFKLNRYFLYRRALRELKKVRLSRRSSKSLRCRLHFARGFAYFRLRKYPKAVPHLTRANRACRRNIGLDRRILYYLGLSYQRWGKWRKGTPYFRTLAQRYPSHYLADDAIFRVADNADRGGNKKEARRYYKELMRRFPRGDMTKVTRWRLAYQAYRYGKWKKAKNLLSRIYRNNPRSKYAAAALYYTARAQTIIGRRNKKNKARVNRLYQRLVRRYPLHYYSFLALSQLRKNTGKRWRLRRCAWKQVKGTLRCVERKRKANRGIQSVPWGPIPLQPPTSQQLGQLYDGAKAPFLRHPNYLRGKELYRLGFQEEAAGEWVKLRSCRVLRSDKKYRRCGRQGDPGAELLGLLFHLTGNYYLANTVFRARGIIAGRLPLNRTTLRTWFVAYPRPFWSIAKRASRRDKVNWPVAYAIMREESAFQESVQSPSTAYGLMQLMMFTAKKEAKSLRWKRRVTTGDLFTAEHNISLGIHHLLRLSRTFKAQLPLIAGAYNAGAHRVRRWLRRSGRFKYDKWVEAVGIKQTRHYIRRVSQSYSIYSLLYSSSAQQFWGYVPFNPQRRPLQ